MAPTFWATVSFKMVAWELPKHAVLPTDYLYLRIFVFVSHIGVIEAVSVNLFGSFYEILCAERMSPGAFSASAALQMCAGGLPKNPVNRTNYF
jgi:hypothetical protein